MTATREDLTEALWEAVREAESGAVTLAVALHARLFNLAWTDPEIGDIALLLQTMIIRDTELLDLERNKGSDDIGNNLPLPGLDLTPAAELLPIARHNSKRIARLERLAAASPALPALHVCRCQPKEATS